MSQLSTLDKTLTVAEDVLDVLRSLQADAVVIGALALAVHGYPRETQDLDLAVAIEPRRLKEIGERLTERGYRVELREPDPLGGVLDVSGPGADLVQLVNFSNPPASGFPRLVADAIATASQFVDGSELRVVDLCHLIAFKLYAGGPRSKLDVLELLDRNRQGLSAELAKIFDLEND
jgi:hypothetical protein